VVGESTGGDGVVGRSSNGHGGRFESGSNGSIIGQVHLVPQTMPVTNLLPAESLVYDIGVLDLLPSQGQGGELLVTQADDGNCVLWMCSRSSAPAEPPSGDRCSSPIRARTHPRPEIPPSWTGHA